MTILLGVCLGLLLTIGPYPILSGPVNQLTVSLADLAIRAVGETSSLVAAATNTATGLDVLAVLLAATAPGIFACVVVAVLKASNDVRRAFLVVSVIGALVGFFVFPFGTALTLLVLVAVVNAALVATTYAFLWVPAIALATAVAAQTVSQLTTESSGPAADATDLFATTTGLPTSFAAVTIGVMVVAPFVAAVGAGVRK